MLTHAHTQAIAQIFAPHARTHAHTHSHALSTRSHTNVSRGFGSYVEGRVVGADRFGAEMSVWILQELSEILMIFFRIF